MHPLGFFKFCVFFAAWIGSALLFPVSIYFSYVFQSPFPFTLLIGYYLYRHFVPVKRSKSITRWLSVETTPYTDSNQIIFEKGAEPPKPNSKVFIAMAPHGVLTMGWSALLASSTYENSDFNWFVAPIMCWLLPIGEFMGWGNCVPADAKTMNRIMKKGENVALLPGGFQEATLYKHGKFRMYLKNRKGFVKYILQHGYSVQIAFCFGEELLFQTRDLLPVSWTLWLNKHQIPAIIFWGKYLFFMPENNVNMTTVIATPMSFPCIPHPTSEEIDTYHKKIMISFQELFDRNKGKYASTGEKAELEIL